jgi:hypothetical protein
MHEAGVQQDTIRAPGSEVGPQLAQKLGFTQQFDLWFYSRLSMMTALIRPAALCR